MIKKILFLTIFIFFELFFLEFNRKSKLPKTSLNEIKIDMQFLEETKTEKLKNLILEEVNAKNQNAKSFVSDDVLVKIWENGQRFKLKADIQYQKPNGFRMIISSIMGKELDLGSNNQKFWYWSRRDRYPGLYWSYYEDFEKTRLKTPFNPIFMKSSLGLEVLDLEKAKIVENEKEIMLTYNQVDSMGRPILYSVFVNKDKKQIDGFLITDMDKKLLVSCEIRSYRGIVPSEILYSWHEENRMMSISLNDGEINKKTKMESFLTPSLKPEINMAEE